MLSGVDRRTFLAALATAPLAAAGVKPLAGMDPAAFTRLAPRLTLAQFARRLDHGRIDQIVELLAQTNHILDDMPFVEDVPVSG